MKVHVLWYDYYEDSSIVGIYTGEGKKKKIEELQQEAYEFYQDLKDNLEEELQELKSIRRIHLEKVNEAIEFYKAHLEDKAQRKRDLIKEDERKLKGIEYIKSELLKFSSPDYVLRQYMNMRHYEWFEEEVIE